MFALIFSSLFQELRLAKETFYSIQLRPLQQLENVFNLLAMWSLLLTFLSIIFTLNSFSANIQGEVLYKDDKVCIQLSETDKVYEVVTPSSEVLESLKKLKTGDLVNGNGQIQLGDRSVLLSTINYVGLKKIIGHWLSKDQFNYFFKDHENLFLSAPILNQTSELTYRVVPGNSEDWSVLFFNKDSVKVGKINFFHKGKQRKQDVLEITLFSSSSGEVEQKITLHKKSNVEHPPFTR